MATSTVNLSPDDVEIQPAATPSLSSDDVEVVGAPKPQQGNPVVDMSKVPGADPGMQSPQQAAGPQRQNLQPQTAIGALTHARVLTPQEQQAAATPATATDATNQTLEGPNTPLGNWHPVQGAEEMGSGVADLSKGLAPVVAPMVGQRDKVQPSQQVDASQAARGGTKIISGAMELGKPAMMVGIGAAPIKMALGYLEGIATGYGAQKVAEHMGLSPDEVEFAHTVGFFLPMTYHTVGAMLRDPDINVRFPDRNNPDLTRATASQKSWLGGRVAVARATTPDASQTRIKVGPFEGKFTRGPQSDVNFGNQAPTGLPGAQGGEQAPPPPPDPVAIQRQEQVAKTTDIASQAAKTNAAAAAAAGLKPNAPPPPKPGEPGSKEAPLPAGMADGALTPETAENVGKAIQTLPPASRPKGVIETVTNLAKWVAGKGTIVGPDNKLHQVTGQSPQAQDQSARTIATKLVNDEVDKQNQQAQQAQDDQEKLQKEQQKEAEENAKTAQEEKEAALEGTSETSPASKTEAPAPPVAIPNTAPVQMARQALKNAPKGQTAEQLEKVVRETVALTTPTRKALVQEEISRRANADEEKAEINETGKPLPNGRTRESIQQDATAAALGQHPYVHVPKGSTFKPNGVEGLNKTNVNGAGDLSGTYYHAKDIKSSEMRDAVQKGTQSDLIEQWKAKHPQELSNDDVEQVPGENVQNANSEGDRIKAGEALLQEHAPNLLQAFREDRASEEWSDKEYAQHLDEVVKEKGLKTGSKKGSEPEVAHPAPEKNEAPAAKAEEKPKTEPEVVQPKKPTAATLPADESKSPEAKAALAKVMRGEELTPEEKALGQRQQDRDAQLTSLSPEEAAKLNDADFQRWMRPRSGEAVTDPQHIREAAQALAARGATSGEIDSVRHRVNWLVEDPAEIESHGMSKEEALEQAARNKAANAEMRKAVQEVEALAKKAEPETKPAEPETKASQEEAKPAKAETIFKPGDKVSIKNADGATREGTVRLRTSGGKYVVKGERKPVPAADLSPAEKPGQAGKKSTKAERERTEKMQTLAEHFTPGNVIKSKYWNSYDKVLKFDPTDNGVGWQVQVIHSDKEGEPLSGERPRWHSTYPDKGDEIVKRGEPTPQATKYKYGNTQADIPAGSDAAKALAKAREAIDPADLAGQGLEPDAHITVRYGISGEELSGIRTYLEAQPSFEATLGKTEAFPPSEHSDGAAPIIAPVESDDLRRMEKELDQHGEFIDRTFPEYKPHATIAYVKPGEAKRYTGMTETEGKTFTVKSVTISKKDGTTEEVELSGGPAEEGTIAGPGEDITIGSAQPEHGSQRADIERTLRQYQEKGKPAIIEGDQLIIPDGRYQMIWKDGRLGISKVHDLAKGGWESVRDRSGIGTKDRWTSFNKAAKDEFDAARTAKENSLAADRAAETAKREEVDKQRAHIAELQIRFTAEMRDKLKGADFKPTTFTPQGPKGAAAPIKGEGLGGLVAHKSIINKGTYDVSHAASGLVAGHDFTNIENAKIGVLRLLGLTDWTQDVEALKKDKELFDKAGKVVMEMRSSGATAMTPDDVRAMEAKPAPEPVKLPAAVEKAADKQEDAVAPGTAVPARHAELTKQIDDLKAERDVLFEASLKQEHRTPERNATDKKTRAIDERIKRLQVELQDEQRAFDQEQKWARTPLSKPEERIVIDRDERKWKQQAEYFIKALEPARDAWQEKYETVPGVNGVLDWKAIVKKSENLKRPESRPAAFPNDYIRIEVPDDGKFLVVNTPAAIDKLLRSAPSAFAKPTGTVPGTNRTSVPRAPKELDTAKLIQQYKAEIEETQQDLTRAEDKDKAFLQEKLDAAKENLAATEKTAQKLEPALMGEEGSVAVPEAVEKTGEYVGKAIAATLKDAIEGAGLAGKSMKAVGREVVSFLYPRALMSEQMKDILGTGIGKPAFTQFKAAQLMNGIDKMFKQMPEDAWTDFVEAYENGKKQASPALDDAAELMRSIIEGQEAEEEAAANLGRKPSQRITLPRRENYFPHRYSRLPGGAADIDDDARLLKMANSRRPLEGSKQFLKQRKMTYRDAIEQGAKPLGTPVDMLKKRLQEGAKYIGAKYIMHSGKKAGLVLFVKGKQPAPMGYVDVPDKMMNVWRPVETADGGVVMKQTGRWVWHEDFGRGLNNYLSKDYIRSSKMGSAINKLKNATTEARLSWSGFHWANMVVENWASGVNIGLDKLYNGGLRDLSGEKFFDGLTDLGRSIMAPFSVLRDGRRILNYTKDPEGFLDTKAGQELAEDYPNLPQLLANGFSGGLRIGLPDTFKESFGTGFVQDLKGGHLGKATLKAFPWLSHMVMKPLFEHYIPQSKLMFFVKMYSHKLNQYSEALAAGEVTEIQLARQVASAADYRFGELAFDNMYWNNTFRAANQIMFRSASWKAGSWMGAAKAVHETVEGFKGTFNSSGFNDHVYDTAEDQTRPFNGARRFTRRLPELGINAGWLMSMGMVVAAASTVLTWMFTKTPIWQWAEQDHQKHKLSYLGALAFEAMHPRTGKLDPHGEPIRISFPTGLKDYEHAWHNPAGYLRGSLSDVIANFMDTMENRDAFGNYVFNPNDPGYQKFLQSLEYNAKGDVSPMSVSNYRDNYGPQDATSKLERATGLVGGSPKEYDRSAALNLALKLRPAAGPHTPEEEEAYQMTKEHPTRHDAKRALKAGQRDYLEHVFMQLSYGDARKVYDEATPEERHELAPLLKKKQINAMKAGRSR